MTHGTIIRYFIYSVQLGVDIIYNLNSTQYTSLLLPRIISLEEAHFHQEVILHHQMK